ncbi:MAG: cell division protein FtsA [bacterium]
MAQKQVLGLDVGSRTIKAVIAERKEGGKIQITDYIVGESRGIRKGIVVDMDEATAALNTVFTEVKRLSKGALKNIYLGVGCSDVQAQISRGIVAVSRANSEIHLDDVTRVLQASEAVNLSANRTILHTITREFIVDGIGDIQDPLGMVGSRLEVMSVVVDIFQPAIRNIMKCIEVSGGTITEIIFSPLAAAESVLTKNQKELGVVIIDIGYGTTGVAVYEENKLLHTKTIPVGAGHITNDLAVALKIPVEVAERIKVAYGYAVSREVPVKENVELRKIDKNCKGNPSRKFIAEIIEARLAEICELVNNELQRIGKGARLPAGVVLVGGGAKLPGIVELFTNEMKLSSQIGLPQTSLFETSHETGELLESPEYSALLGLTVWSDLHEKKQRSLLKGKGVLFRVLKSFLP